ncbi:hypothetical protein [Croceicoccus gelatinilyticus]|uniref:hypothetical protein n=1 Tax=Croceicoccus gelatinilyticus TaxID=2835536 RepID=UPI001CED9373|nr:hypothetical protein [Croceicoccus gelatinilyticus]
MANRRACDVTREGRVMGHRRIALHVWHLVGKALASIGYVETQANDEAAEGEAVDRG